MDPNPRVVFGLSGAAYAAKAHGVKKNSDVGGWHYSPAGEERAVIARASLQPLYPEDTPDEKKLWSRSRLNKVSVGTSGQMIIDDALTCCTQDNYLHFHPARPIPDERNQPFLCPVSPTDEA